MSASRLSSLCALIALAAAACTKEAPSADPQEPWEAPAVAANGETENAPVDLGGGTLPGPARGVRRLRIDTLQAAMSKVAGNDIYGAPILWRVNTRDGFSDLAFGKALGRPDYQTSTEESTVSNALYLKFVGDAARDICMQMAKNDMKRSGDSRALFPKAPVDGTATDAQVNENLQYLVLRFLGLRVAADDSMVTNLRAVYDAGVASVSSPNGGEITAAAEGWRGVCVTLFESPLFHND
ncbi:hypothetical protein [Polyangium jinanense]|uniref:Lipoprotein n=1 Tax=Polyangium jinanense TaxID=2829994 RepID=A0A9X3WXU4_9BACT|nr:hypothetical protein [Polyangium jinanense]MDC3952618.1 hypothetical protein [Polyangium jinanense]MDC3980244.1 hypothetical protein [Polyangium jinanense]